jgi:hypothetical protein
LVVWGDCRGGVKVQNLLMDAIRSREPDITIGLGDFVGMARTYQFQILKDRLVKATASFSMVPGNHDLDPFGTLKPYARVFGPPNWSFARRGVLFLGLNTAHGVADAQDVEWLEQEVVARKADAKHVLLFCHYPVFAPLNRPKKGLPDDPATTRLRALVERESITVFSGNFHGYDAQAHGRAVQVVTGGAGSHPESDAPYHFVWVEVGDAARFEQIVLAQQSEVSPSLDRFLVFKDEANYASGKFPKRTVLALGGFAVFLGGLVGAAWRRRSPHSSSASSA